MSLIAEDLLLLLLDDEDGRAEVWVRGNIDFALAGALLAELALEGVVDVTEAEGFLRPADVIVADTAAVADPLLGHAVATIAEKERSPQTLVSMLRHGLRDALLERLAAAGILRREQETFLIVFERTRWPSVDAAHETEVRRALSAALVDGQTPEPRTGVLIALLKELGQAHKVVPHDGVSDSEIKKRAAEIAEGSWATEGVKKALRQSAAVGGLIGSGAL